MKTPLAAVLLSLAGLAGTAAAADLWVINGQVTLLDTPCQTLLVWRADAVLLNLAGSTARVRVLGVSNTSSFEARDLDIPPRGSRSLTRAGVVSAAPLWIAHLDVPAEVAVDARLEYQYRACDTKPIADVPAGRLATPQFRSLTPPGQRQIHPGSDLGLQPVRVNAGVYNAGAESATATIEVHHGSCDQTVASRIVTIPPNTLIQVSLYDITPGCPPATPLTMDSARWETYTTVVVDQPSLSYAVALSNVEAPRVSVGFASGP